MKSALFLFVALGGVVGLITAHADEYRPISLVNKARPNYADVVEVTVLGTRFEIKTIGNGSLEQRDLVVTLGITSLFSECETLKGVEIRDSQRSLESALNPTDIHLLLRTDWANGCWAQKPGPPEKSSYELRFLLNQRAAGSNAPWPTKPDWQDDGIVYYTFDAGMRAGINWKLIYRLEYSNTNAIDFKLIKRFAYVQGQVITRNP